MKQEALLFTEENINLLFGQLAAEDEDINKLSAYYIKNKTHDKVVADLPLRILVGHKGTGKSAIFAVARHEDMKANRLSILIRPDDIANLGTSEDLGGMIREWKTGLINIITAKIFSYVNVEEHDIFTRLSQLGGKIMEVLVDTFSSKIQQYGNISPTAKLIIEQFLKEHRIIIYIDDLDRGWESHKHDILRISALLNAVRDLCNDNKGLQFRISLRTDVYYLVRTADESTDKIANSVIWLSWTNHEILLLLIKRIEHFWGRNINIEQFRAYKQAQIAHFLDTVFEKRFNGLGKWANAPMYKILMSLIRKRPRDLVLLCTLAAKEASDRNAHLISTEHFEAIFSEYSNGRMQDTTNEYKSELPQIERLLLNMKPSQKEVKQHVGYVYDTNRLKQKVRTIIERGPFRYANNSIADEGSLLQFMYKINFLTARKVLEDGSIERKYFEENKYLSSQVADFGYCWEIHPAFRWALKPDSVESILADIDQSLD